MTFWISSTVFKSDLLLCSVRQLLVIANVVPTSPILVTLMMEALVPLIHRFLQEPYNVTSQQTLFFIVTTVKTSNLNNLFQRLHAHHRYIWWHCCQKSCTHHTQKAMISNMLSHTAINSQNWNYMTTVTGWEIKSWLFNNAEGKVSVYRAEVCLLFYQQESVWPD
jgi:hypothetical protein